jgi:hypothetical protein
MTVSGSQWPRGITDVLCQGRRTRLKFFLLLAMVFAPATGICALLCFTLSDPDFLQLPWVAEFTGIDVTVLAADLVNTHVIADGNLAGNNGTDAEAVEMAGHRDTVLSYGVDLGEQKAVEEAMEILMYEMPTAGWCMVGTTISMVCVIVLVGKALGGFRFVAVALCTFTALLNLVNGLGIAVVGYMLHADASTVLRALDGDLGAGEASDLAADTAAAAQANVQEDFDGFDASERSLFNAVIYVAGVMVVQSLAGLLGAKLSDNGGGRLLLKVYGLSLLLILIALVAILVIGAYYQGKVGRRGRCSHSLAASALLPWRVHPAASTPGVVYSYGAPYIKL